MRQVQLPLAEIELIAVTRVALGVGLGLLLASRLTSGERRAIGWALIVVGGLATFPLRADVLGQRSRSVRQFDERSLASPSS